MKTECLGKTERKQRARNEKEMIIKEKVFLEKSKNIERSTKHSLPLTRLNNLSYEWEIGDFVDKNVVVFLAKNIAVIIL